MWVYGDVGFKTGTAGRKSTGVEVERAYGEGLEIRNGLFQLVKALSLCLQIVRGHLPTVLALVGYLKP